MTTCPVKQQFRDTICSRGWLVTGTQSSWPVWSSTQ